MEKNEYLSYFPDRGMPCPFAKTTGAFIMPFIFGYINVKDFCTEEVWKWRNDYNADRE